MTFGTVVQNTGLPGPGMWKSPVRIARPPNLACAAAFAAVLTRWCRWWCHESPWWRAGSARTLALGGPSSNNLGSAALLRETGRRGFESRQSHRLGYTSVSGIAPLIPSPAWILGRGGRSEESCHRQLIDAILYPTDNGIKWRAMPADLPARDGCYRPTCSRRARR